MKQIILLLVIVLASVMLVTAQVRGRPESTPQTQADKAVKTANDLNRRSNELRNTETFIGNDMRNRETAKIFRRSIRPLYRKAKKSELKLMAPNEKHRADHAGFLKKKNTGLIKLARDRGCADVVNVVEATKECAEYSMPGAGSSYSFRIKQYRLKNLGDLNFTGRNFQALGVLLHGIMVNLGDVPLEKVDKNTGGYGFIKSFKPAKNFQKAAEFATKLQKGIDDSGYKYASVLEARVNSTYILRSIAYRGVSPRTVANVTYNELDFDKRKDITVAFQVLQKDNDSITILWKQMASKNAPKLEAKK